MIIFVLVRKVKLLLSNLLCGIRQQLIPVTQLAKNFFFFETPLWFESSVVVQHLNTS